MGAMTNHAQPSEPALDLLACYLRAVQHPEAEIGFLFRAYMTLRGQTPTKLKEDFAGTAAVATAWVNYHDACVAVAVEIDRATVQWARNRAAALLSADQLSRLSIIQADVKLVEEPRVDIVAAMNFSIFGYHDRDSLRSYFKAARSSLLPGGMLVFDAFGGPGAMRPGTQSRPVAPAMFIDEDDDTAHDPAAAVPENLTYHWEQRSYDALSGMIDCRIHFGLDERIVAPDAFVYDWRLWTLPELLEVVREAGFSDATVWCDEVDEETGEADGSFEPADAIPARDDWVAYVVAER